MRGALFFSLCISVLRSTGVKISLSTPLEYMSKGGLEEGSWRLCLLVGHILCPIINLSFCWARNWL